MFLSILSINPHLAYFDGILSEQKTICKSTFPPGICLICLFLDLKAGGGKNKKYKQ
jgi:hypothetical protein